LIVPVYRERLMTAIKVQVSDTTMMSKDKKPVKQILNIKTTKYKWPF